MRLLLAGLLALTGCASAAPEAPTPVNLTGATVMLLPAQAETEGLDPELGFWLRELAPRTDWVLPATLRAAVDRSPAWRVDLDALPPGFAEVGGRQRVRDPLYGHLRRLGAMVDTRLALVPYATETTDTAGAALEITAVLVDVVGGRVVWHGTARGTPAPPGARPSAASAAEALARALVPL